MKKAIFFIYISLTFIFQSMSQEVSNDLDGCENFPLLKRMEAFYISDCYTNFNNLDFFDIKGEKVLLEGLLTTIFYTFKTESTGDEPSTAQIIKFYSKAINKLDGKKIFTDDEHICFELKHEAKEYRIMINGFTNNGNDKNTQFILNVLELVTIVQEVSATEMLDALNKEGHIGLDILFDTNNASVKTQWKVIVDQIYELLKNNDNLEVSIEGHTDNVGEPEKNLSLSEERAKSVMNMLIAKGINKNRLSSIGKGETIPIADNATIEGKAKNRRVEIVKK